MSNVTYLYNFWTSNIFDSFWTTFLVNIGLRIEQDLEMSETYTTGMDQLSGLRYRPTDGAAGQANPGAAAQTNPVGSWAQNNPRSCSTD